MTRLCGEDSPYFTRAISQIFHFNLPGDRRLASGFGDGVDGRPADEIQAEEGAGLGPAAGGGTHPSGALLGDAHLLGAYSGRGRHLISKNGGTLSGGDTDENSLLTGPTGLRVLLEPEFVLGLAAVPMFIRLLHSFTADREMGVLIVIIHKMLSDVLLFFRLVGSLLIGFGIAFVGILRTQAAYVPISRYEDASMAASLVATEQGWTISSALGVPLWATVGENQIEVVTASSPFWGTALLWVFVIVAQVLLVNLLIAMMGTTYSTYNKDAEQVHCSYA